jgi:hypothetical protein
MKRTLAEVMVMTSEQVRLPSPKKRTPRVRVPTRDPRLDKLAPPAESPKD